MISVVADLLYHVSLALASTPTTSVSILLLGRAFFGAAENFIITGALSWGLALGGAANTGKVMAWIGMAMYVAFAVGAPVGTALYSGYGFVAIALATTLIPLGTSVTQNRLLLIHAQFRYYPLPCSYKKYLQANIRHKKRAITLTRAARF